MHRHRTTECKDIARTWDGSFLLTSHDASKPRTVSSRCCPTSSLSSSTRSAAASLASVFPDSLRSSVEKLM
eukprot:1801845-Rhodomonas_salina.9